MGMVYRYFIAGDEKHTAIEDTLARVREEEKQAQAEAGKLAADNGFGGPRWIRGRLVGFTMPDDVDLSGFKYVADDEERRSVYRPKWNTPLGRSIRKQFNAIGWSDVLETLLRECFPNARGIMVIGGPAPRWGHYTYSPSLHKINGQWVLKVPAYEKGSHYEGREHYTPDEGATEISEADYLELKAAALRAEEAENE